jgi:hypothetical protein
MILVGALTIACDAGGSRERVGGRETTTDGARPENSRLDSVGLRRGKCRGVSVETNDDPQRIMRRHPPGTTYCLGEGVHRIRRPLKPQEGDTIAGRDGAILSGAAVLTDWEAGPDGWTAQGLLPPSPSTHGPCLRSAPWCTLAEDVFVDGRRLTRVGSVDDVVPGTFYGDYARNTVTVGSDPAGTLVEQAVASSLIRSGRDRVTVRDLVLEMAANEAQVAAVDSRRTFPRAGIGWRVLHNDVRLNHGVGVGVAGHGRVRRNIIREQGQLGVSAWGEDVDLLDNEISHNGLAGYDPEWEAGGVKFWMTVGAVVSGNHVHHNQGPGLWSDGGCDKTEYRRNLVTDNWLAGIQHEISYDALIARNRILRNGAVHKGWAWESGIQIQSSGGRGLIEVRRNVVAGNTHGITVIDSSDRRREEPHPRGLHVVRNVLIHHNEIAMSPDQWSGVFHDYGDHSVFDRNLRFRSNTYHLESHEQRSFGWEDELLTWEQWRGRRAGQDRGGTLVIEDGS